MLIYTVLFFAFFSVNSSEAHCVWKKTKYEDIALINHFWRSTGLCPTSSTEGRTRFLLSHDEEINLYFIGALPNGGISTVRIHWLLDLLRVREVIAGKPIYEFKFLDQLIGNLNRSGLNPIFEIMGNPSNYFFDFKKQFHQWVDLLRQIKKRYTGTYGLEYIRKWKFELTNEPDLKLYNIYNFTLDKYIDYFRASEFAVLKVIGPAGLFRNNKKVHSLCWGLLNHCNLNPCNLDMITFHRKGDETGSKVVEQGLELINSLISIYPNLRGIPFGNDEADIQTGWIKPLEWRADVRYAALVVQVIIGHVKEILIRRNISFELLSNDNAFLSFSPHYFSQRTLLARFQINTTSPPHVQFIRKPVYSVMGLLSLLGNKVKDIHYHPGESGFSYMATSGNHYDSFIGVIVNDKAVNESYKMNLFNSIDVKLKIILRNSTLSAVAVGYIMDNFWNNPYDVWRKAGSPDFPNADLRHKMRKAEGFRRIFLKNITPHQSFVEFAVQNVYVPSVFSVNSCFFTTVLPGAVNDLNYVRIHLNEILLLWKDIFVGRCILTYVVEYKSSNDIIFRRINFQDTIFLSYHFDGNSVNDILSILSCEQLYKPKSFKARHLPLLKLDTQEIGLHLFNNSSVFGKMSLETKSKHTIGSMVGVSGQYRVAAMDYWNRTGPFSNTLTVEELL